MTETPDFAPKGFFEAVAAEFGVERAREAMAGLMRELGRELRANVCGREAFDAFMSTAR